MAYGVPGQCVLHVDCDSFFCQVEVLRNPSLSGIPLAIQQHQDVIAVNYPARQAGVKKHMAPPQARALLSAAGGRLVHVFTEPDGRVSYRPYREASAALMRLLRAGLPAPPCLAVRVVEKASIDEAFIAVGLPGQGTAGAQQQQQQQQQGLPPTAHDAGSPPAAAMSWDLSVGAEVAAAVRAAAQQSLGLTLSVGCAPNKLLAKLASRAAKPDGMLLVDSRQGLQQLLASSPVERLPGLGGAVATALSGAGISHIAQLQAYTQQQLAALLGGQQQLKLAGRLVDMGWGRDGSPVLDKGPPKSIQVQMTLTPQLRPLPPSLATAAAAAKVPIAGQAGGIPAHPPLAAAAGSAGSAVRGPCDAPGAAVLMPLLTGAADTAPRLTAVLGAMTGDLLGRVLLDRHAEDRWPRKLALTLTTSGQPPRTATRSTAFPTPALAAAETQQQQQQQQQQEEGRGVSDGPAAAAPPVAPPASTAAFQAPGVVGEKSFTVGSGLHDAVLGLATGLAQVLVAPLPPAHPITQLNLAVSNFGPFEAAAAAGDIRRFTTAAPAPAPAAAPVPADSHPAGATQQHRQQPQQALQQQAAHAVQGRGTHRHTSSELHVAIAEQHQQLSASAAAVREQQQKRQQQQQHQLAPASAPAAQPHARQQAATRAAAGSTACMQLDSPPVLLSGLLHHLACSSTTASEAEQQLAGLLAAAGGLARVLPDQKGP